MAIVDPTPPDMWKPLFFRTLSKCGNMSAAARAVGISVTTIRRLRSTDADFRDQTDLAIDIAVDRLEEEAYERAISGNSDALLMFLLKAHRPDIYRENVRHEHSGPDGGAIPVKAYMGFDPGRWDEDSLEQTDQRFKVVDGEAIAIEDSRTGDSGA